EQVPLSLAVPAGQWRKRLDSAEPRWQGSGSELPESIDSRGNVSLSVAASAFCLFSQAVKNHK
ncbi:MAG: hypothetical protein WA224_19570, partial [Candidatus Acidiferrales bacterium]